jgi:outer membrane protein assembly factor BamB
MRWLSRLAIVLVVCFILSGCWPQPQFDAGRTNTNPHENVLTRATVGRLGVLWATDVQPGGRVTGIVSVGDGVYTTAVDGRVARLDARTGEPVWSQVVDAGQAPIPPPATEPVYFGNRLRVSWACCRSGVAGTFWLDPANGDLTGAPDGATGGLWDPAIAGGSLAGWDDTPPLFRTLTWGSRSVIATGGDGVPPGSSFAIVGDGLHWSRGNLALRFGPECRPGTIPGLPGLSCEPDWENDLGAPPASVAAVGTDAVMWTDWSGGVTVLDAATGAVRWRATVGTLADVPPVVAAGGIVVATQDGLVGLPARGCGAATCGPVWRAPVDGLTGLAGGGELVFATTSRGDVAAYAVDGCGASTCEPLAEVDVGDADTLSPIVDGGRLLVGDASGRVVALGLPPSST